MRSMAQTPEKVRTLTVECPQCEGEGEVESFEDIADHHFGHSTRAVWVECDECDGDGTIEVCAVCVERTPTLILRSISLLHPAKVIPAPAGDDLAHGYKVTP